MLLIDYDKLKTLNRRINCRSCADYDTSLSESNPSPLIIAFTIAKVAVKNSDTAAETTAESIGSLRRKRYFGNKNYRASACFKHIGNCLHVYLCLTAAGHSMQENAAAFFGRPDHVKCIVLVNCKRQRLALCDSVSGKRISERYPAGFC